jgi:hypothetical protein
VQETQRLNQSSSQTKGISPHGQMPFSLFYHAPSFHFMGLRQFVAGTGKTATLQFTLPNLQSDHKK